MKQRCFPLPEASVSAPVQHPLLQWLASDYDLTENLSAVQQQALARLVPLLLCGEQSAVHVFNSEYNRQQQSRRYLAEIEADERLHEEALQQLLEQLPDVTGMHKIKRQAQLFYARIQQATDSVAAHFYTISQLDACVCVLMNAVANSSIKGSRAARLFTLIKQDEARHVSIAKKHARELQADIEQHNGGMPVQQGLVDLLRTQQQAFRDLDIDTEQLFSRLQNMAVKVSADQTMQGVA